MGTGMNDIDGWTFTRPLALAALLLVGLFADGASLDAQERAFGLEQAVRRALSSNRDVISAQLGLQEAEERVSEAWGNVYPTVDLNAGYPRNVSPTVNFLPAQIFDPAAGPDDYIGVRFGADNQWNSTLSIEQPIFRPSVFVALGAAGRFEDLQRESVRGQTQAVVTRVRVAYYQLLLAQEQERLTENSVSRVRQSLTETQALYRAGLASEYAVLRLEVELANLEPNLRRSENAARQSRRLLAVELDEPNQESVAVLGELAEMNLDDFSANSPANQEILSFMGFEDAGSQDAALRSAVELRSDVRQLGLNEALARTEMKLEQAQYLPEVTLWGNYVINAQDNGSPNFFARGDGQRAYSRLVGLRVSIPIFQGFKRDARIDQKRALVRQAGAQAAQGLDRAASQVKGLVESTEEASLRARAQRRAVEQAYRGFEIPSAQYREGISSQLELTDAEVALRQSEFNYAQSVYDYLVARAQLDEATGRVPLVDVDAANDRF